MKITKFSGPYNFVRLELTDSQEMEEFLSGEDEGITHFPVQFLHVFSGKTAATFRRLFYGASSARGGAELFNKVLTVA